jgi:hypothetical protein
MCNVGRPITAIALALGFLAPAARAESNSIDGALLKRAPEIIKFLRDKGYTNVGVLKFLVQKGNEPTTDNIGPLNLAMARRLEVALVLCNPDDKMGIIRNASAAVVDSKRKASHLSADGIKELFNVPYALAWGTDDEPIKADAFVTGVVQLSPDLATTTVRVQAFGKDHPEPTEVCRFEVPTDARTLTESGRSYRLRGTSPAKNDEPADVAQQTEAGKTKHPLDGPDVQWDIYYDNVKVPVVVKSGKATVKGPQAGQAVRFEVHNKGKKRCGVVLRVNGENTLYREKLPSYMCQMWILDPGESADVRGFQSDENTAAGFKVLSPEESEKEEVNYGEHAGTFSMEVFHARSTATPVVTEDPRVKAVEAGVLPADKPIKLQSLQQKVVEPFNKTQKVSKGLRQTSGANKDGIVVGGQAVQSLTERVPFECGPTPVLSATVRYYTPGR